MFAALGRLAVRRHSAVLAAWLALTVVAVVWGVSALGSLLGGGFEDPGSESYRAEQASAPVGDGRPHVVAIYRSTKGRTVDDPAFRTAVETALTRLPQADIASTTTFWSSGWDALVSFDREATSVLLDLRGGGAYDRVAAS